LVLQFIESETKKLLQLPHLILFLFLQHQDCDVSDYRCDYLRYLFQDFVGKSDQQLLDAGVADLLRERAIHITSQTDARNSFSCLYQEFILVTAVLLRLDYLLGGVSS
jgi:hypothetical protein